MLRCDSLGVLQNTGLRKSVWPILAALIIGAALSSTSVAQTVGGGWTAVPSMANARFLHSATLLADGRVLVAGGFNTGPTGLDTAEVYNPATNAWTTIPSMSSVHYFHTATLLLDGRVLVASGLVNNPSTTPTVEMYDPVANAWTSVASIGTPRYSHTATLLSDGRVLIAGGVINAGNNVSAAAEVFDPTTNTWTTVPSMSTPRELHTATLLADGRVLVTGGNGFGIRADAEIYDPVANAWTSVPDMAIPRLYHTATRLNDGRVLVAGGFYFSALAEIYNPVTNAWSSIPSMGSPRYSHTATLLGDGNVLVAGGSPMYPDPPVASSEVYAPSSNAWTTTSNMAAGRMRHTDTLLADGRVLVAGGLGANGTTATAEVYTPANTSPCATNSAPTVTTMSGPAGPLALGGTASIVTNFTDINLNNTHTCSIAWGDGVSTVGTISGSTGSGSCTGSHQYSATGVYPVTSTITDSCSASATGVYEFVVIYDPSGGFVTGGGWINSPAGSYVPNPSLTGKANFGFVSKYKNGAAIPTGNTEFNFSTASFNFTSTSYQWLVISGAKAQYKGTGKVNGSGDYGFLLTVTDGNLTPGGVDKFRIKVWDQNQGNGVVYDSQLNASDGADPTTAIGGGSIVIHK